MSEPERKVLVYLLGHILTHMKEVVERRASLPFFRPPPDEELVLQRMIPIHAERMLEANMLRTEEEVAMAKSIIRDLQGELEENRAIEEALREAVLEEVREEAMAARRVGEIETEMGKMTVNKKKKNKKKKRGGRRGKKAAAVTARADEGAYLALEKEKEEEDDDRKEADEVTDRDCSICFMEMSLHDDEDEEEDEQEKTLTLTCRHRFHSVCMELWTNRCVSKGITPSCPMCRGTL